MNRSQMMERLETFNEEYSALKMKQREEAENKKGEFLDAFLPNKKDAVVDLTEVAEKASKNFKVKDLEEKNPINENIKKAEEQAKEEAKTKGQKFLQNVSKAQEITDDLNLPSLSNLPTPGGIALLLLVILFILFAVMPVKGKDVTRLGLLWRVLIGEGQLSSPAEKEASEITTVETAGWFSKLLTRILTPPSVQVAGQLHDLKDAVSNSTPVQSVLSSDFDFSSFDSGFMPNPLGGY